MSTLNHECSKDVSRVIVKTARFLYLSLAGAASPGIVASSCGGYDISYNVDPNRTTNPGVPIASLYPYFLPVQVQGCRVQMRTGMPTHFY